VGERWTRKSAAFDLSVAPSVSPSIRSYVSASSRLSSRPLARRFTGPPDALCMFVCAWCYNTWRFCQDRVVSRVTPAQVSDGRNAIHSYGKLQRKDLSALVSMLVPRHFRVPVKA
jgi:hypothetical protein